MTESSITPRSRSWWMRWILWEPGDSFATAFLLAMLEKKDIHAAMEAGAEFAAKTCLVNGAFGHGIAFQEE